MNGPDLSTIGGIVAATIILVGVAKRLLGNVSIIRKCPTWICAVIVAVALTVVARYAIGTLAGNVWQLLGQAIVAAALASGFRDWWTYAGHRLEDSDAAMVTTGKSITGGTPVLALAACLALGGCTAVSDSYIAADRATYQAIAPEYSAYVAADPGLSIEQKTRRANTVATWRMRIESATTRPN